MTAAELDAAGTEETTSEGRRAIEGLAEMIGAKLAADSTSGATLAAETTGGGTTTEGTKDGAAEITSTGDGCFKGNQYNPTRMK